MIKRDPLCLGNWPDGYEKYGNTEYEYNGGTGCYEEITRFIDGSSIRHCGGPCADIYYDENGDEC